MDTLFICSCFALLPDRFEIQEFTIEQACTGDLLPLLVDSLLEKLEIWKGSRIHIRFLLNSQSMIEEIKNFGLPDNKLHTFSFHVKRGRGESLRGKPDIIIGDFSASGWLGEKIRDMGGGLDSVCVIDISKFNNTIEIITEEE